MSENDKPIKVIKLHNSGISGAFFPPKVQIVKPLEGSSNGSVQPIIHKQGELREINKKYRSMLAGALLGINITETPVETLDAMKLPAMHGSVERDKLLKILKAGASIRILRQAPHDVVVPFDTEAHPNELVVDFESMSTDKLPKEFKDPLIANSLLAVYRGRATTFDLMKVLAAAMSLSVDAQTIGAEENIQLKKVPPKPPGSAHYGSKKRKGR